MVVVLEDEEVEGSLQMDSVVVGTVEGHSCTLYC